MTETVRIAYSWCERNQIGEPLEVVRYGSRQWETGKDEDEALAQACSWPPSSEQSVSIQQDNHVGIRLSQPHAGMQLIDSLRQARLPPHLRGTHTFSPGAQQEQDCTHRPMCSLGPVAAISGEGMVEIVAGLIWLVTR